MYIVGIDEAGRGPAIGPMVLAAVKLHSNEFESLKCLGVKDSKSFGSGKLARSMRQKICEELMRIITPANYKVTIIPPEEIDCQNLTELEIHKIATLINCLAPEKAIIDALGKLKPSQFLYRLKERLTKPDIHIIYQTAADKKHIPVAAASIIAKVTRDQAIELLHKKIGQDFGSGYVNPKTNEFIRTYLNNYRELPPGTRKRWANVRRIVSKYESKKE